MILRYSLAAAALCAAIVLAWRWHSSTDPTERNEVIAERVLKALATDDYTAFVAHADRNVQRFPRADFHALTERHAARLRSGHTLQPLDQRWRGSVHLCRWKVRFNDGSPDAVLMLGLKEGKVATFAIY